MSLPSFANLGCSTTGAPLRDGVNHEHLNRDLALLQEYESLEMEAMLELGSKIDTLLRMVGVPHVVNPPEGRFGRVFNTAIRLKYLHEAWHESWRNKTAMPNENLDENLEAELNALMESVGLPGINDGPVDEAIDGVHGRNGYRSRIKDAVRKLAAAYLHARAMIVQVEHFEHLIGSRYLPER